jgi:hypothetical protein
MLLQPEDYKLCGALPHAKETRRYTHVVKNVVFVVFKHYDVNNFQRRTSLLKKGCVPRPDRRQHFITMNQSS